VTVCDRGRKLWTAVFGPISARVYTPRMNWLRRVPIIPRNELPPAPRPPYTRETPEDLRTVPGVSGPSERHTMRVYKELTDRTSALAEFLHAKGFRAQPHPYGRHAVTIHYAVEAGLGQLGLNGQLLTPQAGSRLRLDLIRSYHWVDGKHDGPGEKPRITPAFVKYGELDLDPHRDRPVEGTVVNRVDYREAQVP